MNTPLVCEYRQASGRAFNDCVIIGRRYLEDVGPRGEDGFERDHYVLITEPAEGDRTMLHATYQYEDFLTGIWRATAGEVFVTGAVLGGVYLFRDVMDWQRGSEKMPLNDMTPEGVWGLDGTHVYVWGTRMDAARTKTYPVFVFDGTSWSEMPSLPHPCNAIHGTRPDHLYAVGRNGMIARWDGNAWHSLESPSHTIITDIHVESADEQYAVTLDGALLEGNAAGWAQTGTNPLGATPFSSVAKFRGDVYVGANAVGLMKRTADGGVEEFKPNVGAIHMEVRENLIITMPGAIVGSSDGEHFQGAGGGGQFDQLTAHKPLAGLNRG